MAHGCTGCKKCGGRCTICGGCTCPREVQSFIPPAPITLASVDSSRGAKEPTWFVCKSPLGNEMTRLHRVNFNGDDTTTRCNLKVMSACFAVGRRENEPAKCIECEKVDHG